MKKYKKGGGISPGLSKSLTGEVKSIIGDEEKVMNNKPSKYTVGRDKSRMPKQTGPRKITDRGPSRIMKPMPITPDLKRKLKDRDMKPLPITPKDRERMKDRIMKPMKAGGAAGQTKSTKRPMQSIFQQLKKAQMVRKHDGRGKK